MSENVNAAAVTVPESAPGARCAYHPEDEAKQTCEVCGSFACWRCFEIGENGKALCRPCLAKVPVLAERSARLFAAFIDGLTYAGPVVVALVFGLMLQSSGVAALQVLPYVVGGLGVLAVMVWQGILVDRHGQSVGKRKVGIRVVRTDGTQASLMHILFVRNGAVMAIGFVFTFFLERNLFGLVDTLFIFGAARRCLHDYLADTRVVNAPTEAADTLSLGARG